MEPLLGSLVRKEVLSLQADPALPEHGQYGFLQDLVRRVAYETLARRDRKARHLAAAEQIAMAIGEEDVPEVIASHLVAAREAAPEAEDAAAITGRAGRMYVLAGERAARLAAAGEAQRFFELAAELSDEPAACAELIDRAGRMAWIAGRKEDARELLDRARARTTSSGTRSQEALGRLEARGHRFQRRPDPRGCRPHDAGTGGDRAGWDTGGRRRDGGAARPLPGFRPRVRAAAANLERALELAEAFEFPETLAHALNSKSVLMLYVGRPHESRLLVRGALAVALEHDLHDAALRAYNNVIAECWYDARFRDAIALIDRRSSTPRTGERVWELVFLSARLGHLDFLGRWDEALESAAASSRTHRRNSSGLCCCGWSSPPAARRSRLGARGGRTEHGRRESRKTPTCQARFT